MEDNVNIDPKDLLDAVLNDAKLFTMQYVRTNKTHNENNLLKADKDVQKERPTTTAISTNK